MKNEDGENEMSAPDTNVEKQAKRHKGPLLGIIAGIIVVGLMFLGLIFWVTAQSDDETTQSRLINDTVAAAPQIAAS